jgi:WD40-like Beta Propeller Repeat.
MFSPNGKWVAFTGSRQGNGRELWAVTMNGSQGNLLASINEKKHTGGTLMIYLLGWTDKNKVLFARQGTQPDGPYQGERGISLRIVSPEGNNAQELSWIPVSKGMVKEVGYFSQQDFIIIRTTGSIWRVDLTSGQEKLLRKDLPNYDGLFRAGLSPGGDYYVYELRKDNKWCICCLNTLTGEENLVVSEGKTFNFYPQWSPDGQYLVLLRRG